MITPDPSEDADGIRLTTRWHEQWTPDSLYSTSMILTMCSTSVRVPCALRSFIRSYEDNHMKFPKMTQRQHTSKSKKKIEQAHINIPYHRRFHAVDSVDQSLSVSLRHSCLQLDLRDHVSDAAFPLCVPLNYCAA